MALLRKKQKNTNILNPKLPAHVGIIMDGNGRWAKKKGLPRSAGHVAGANTFRTIARYCSTIGIKHLTVYAFSTENWRRPEDEIAGIMKLFKSYLIEAITDFKDDDIILKFIGDTTAFSDELKELISEAERESSHRDGMILNIAMNYGGRSELLRAAKKIASDCAAGRISSEDIDEAMISNELYTCGQPDPDLIIRPSGEYRTSNFLLWQSAYSEYVIMDILWPDFKTEDLDKALDIYYERNRRFGGI